MTKDEVKRKLKAELAEYLSYKSLYAPIVCMHTDSKGKDRVVIDSESGICRCKECRSEFALKTPENMINDVREAIDTLINAFIYSKLAFANAMSDKDDDELDDIYEHLYSATLIVKSLYDLDDYFTEVYEAETSKMNMYQMMPSFFNFEETKNINKSNESEEESSEE